MCFASPDHNNKATEVQAAITVFDLACSLDNGTTPTVLLETHYRMPIILPIYYFFFFSPLVDNFKVERDLGIQIYHDGEGKFYFTLETGHTYWFNALDDAIEIKQFKTRCDLRFVCE